MLIPFLSYLFLFGAGANASALPSKTIVLAPGRSTNLPTSSSGIIHLANGRLVRVQDGGSYVRLSGKKIGKTQLSIGKKQFEIVVTKNDTADLYEKFNTRISKMMGLETTWEQNELVVSGELLRLEDWLELASVNAGTKFYFKASMSDQIKSEAISYFTQLLTSQNLTVPKIRLDGGAKITAPNSKSIGKVYEQTFRPFGFEISLDDKLVELEPMVEVEIVVAEIRRKTFSKLGLQWPTSYSAKVLPAPEVSATEFMLHTLEEKGLGKVLASPKLLCRSGKEAQFLAGGEFPIKVVNFKVNDVVWKKHGVLLKVKPLVDSDGRMSIALETEVSMIDHSQVVDGIPGLLTNRIQSHFDLERSETIALSGLIKKEWGKARTGLPALSSIPVLGYLFSSEDFREDKTELVVFVTPRVIPTKGINQNIKMPEDWDVRD